MTIADSEPVDPSSFVDALASFATGVAVVSARDDLDDIAMTATSFGSVSLEPPLVFLGVDLDTHMNDVLTAQPQWAITFLSSQQRALAGRFGASGRPSARLLLASDLHHRGPHTNALIIDGGVGALECQTVQWITAGDHVVLIAQTLAVDYLDEQRLPLIRFRRSYPPLNVG